MKPIAVASVAPLEDFKLNLLEFRLDFFLAMLIFNDILFIFTQRAQIDVQYKVMWDISD